MTRGEAALSADSRKISAARLFSAHEDMFRCPVCSRPMKVEHLRSLICSKQHCFDIARQGYINLLIRPPKTKYDKKLFEARKQFSQGGFFDPLLDEICKQMTAAMPIEEECIKVLDAGCGEGSHLVHIQQRFDEHAQSSLGVGIDIAKEGIQMAARHDSRTIWLAADLANSPFMDRQFHFILNILSPSNYSEFSRLLADDGVVIKVVPESRYLRELRALLYEKTDQITYVNKDIVEQFKRNFDLVDIQHVQYGMTLEKTHMEAFVQMTPLSWRASEERVRQVLEKEQLEVTFDFAVLLGKN